MSRHQTPQPCRYDRPYLIRFEISHVDHDTPALLSSLQPLIRLEGRRGGDLPTSEVTCLLWTTSPQRGLAELKDQLDDLIDQHRPETTQIDALREQVIRAGWASLDDVLDLNQLEPAWNWDTIDHDCTQHRTRLVYGMYMPTPQDNLDEVTIAGYQPGQATWQCRICTTRW